MMEKPILGVFLRDTLKGPVLEFRWANDAEEFVRREASRLAQIGEALASFGEQLKNQGLGVTEQGPSKLYGPDGWPLEP